MTKRTYKLFKIPEVENMVEFKSRFKQLDSTSVPIIKDILLKVDTSLLYYQDYPDFLEYVIEIQKRVLPIKMLYLAPETLLNNSVIELINNHVNLSFIAIDERTLYFFLGYFVPS
jgi:superfamily II DNA helicase RecQ